MTSSPISNRRSADATSLHDRCRTLTGSASGRRIPAPHMLWPENFSCSISMDQGHALPEVDRTAADGELLDAYSTAVIGAVDKAGPSVVHIAVKTARAARAAGLGLRRVCGRAHLHQQPCRLGRQDHQVGTRRRAARSGAHHRRGSRYRHRRHPHRRKSERGTAGAARFQGDQARPARHCHRQSSGLRADGDDGRHQRHWPLACAPRPAASSTTSSRPTRPSIPAIPADRWSIRRAASSASTPPSSWAPRASASRSRATRRSMC